MRPTTLSAAMFILFVGATTRAAQAPRDPEALAPHKASLERWLAQTDLANDLRVEKLRWGLNPASDVAKDLEALRLELRFVTQSTDQEEEDKRFQQFLKRYRTAYGATVPERVFYRLIHECQVGRQESAVTIRVVQREYVIFSDPATAELKIQAKADRSGIVKEVPLDLSRSASGGLQATLVKSPSVDRRALSGVIESFLHDYFNAANRQAHLSGPMFAPDGPENRDHDHVGFVVRNIKSQVLKTNSYWEQLDISIDVVQAPGGVKLLCHIDGFYASGIGGKLPDEAAYNDMRRGFQGPLKTFADGLLLQLQRRIEGQSQ